MLRASLLSFVMVKVTLRVQLLQDDFGTQLVNLECKLKQMHRCKNLILHAQIARNSAEFYSSIS
jgi:hypothetical protein